MKIFYRISDKGNPKEKLPGADKYFCLNNALEEFGRENFYVILDNCNKETVEFVRKKGLTCEETSLGNSGSFRYMVKKILASLPDQEFVYLLEDDYFHLPGSKQILEEGCHVADYVTLYDHPDKYRLVNEGGNPFNKSRLQKQTLSITEHSHWESVNSTTMTFACSVSTLRQDFPVWEKYTKTRNPKDFRAFMELSQNGLIDAMSFLFRGKKRPFFIIFKNFLTRNRMRKIISSIPGKATHVETAYLSPVIDWYSLIDSKYSSVSEEC